MLSLFAAWHAQVLAPQQRVLFLDTDSMPAPEVRAGDALRNPREAAIIGDIVRALDLGRVPLHDIGIISPFRAQVSEHLCMHVCMYVCMYAAYMHFSTKVQ